LQLFAPSFEANLNSDITFEIQFIFKIGLKFKYMNGAEFRKRTRDLDRNGQEFKKLESEFLETQHLEKKHTERKRAMSVRILDLTHIVKGLNLTKLNGLKEQELILIGKSLKELNLILRKAGIDSY
jgi:hypothetical protein